nr:RHS repeat-associated core domain-containing protein [Listeria weihenstephanensis]
MIYPDGTRVTYRYDDTNQLTDVIEADGKKTTYDYDANGLPLAIHYSNGTKTTYRYSAIGETEHVETSNKAGKVIASFDYTYDENGNVTKETINQNGTKQVKIHTYDADDQLIDTTIKAGKNTEVITYIYDANGNRTKLKRVKNGKKTIENYHYDDDNVLAMIQADGDADTTYIHDKNGNITKKALRSGKVETYTYNGENQLIQSADNEGHVTTYNYDAFGNRIGKETITDKTKEVQGTLSEWITAYDKQAKDNLKVTPGKTATEGTTTKQTESTTKTESLAKQLEKRASGDFEGCSPIAEEGTDVVTKDNSTKTTSEEGTTTKTKDGIQGKTELKESDGNSSTSTERTTETTKSVGYQAITTIRYINDLTQEYTQVAQLDETTEDNGETTETSTDYRFGEDDQILGTEDESYHENGLTDITTTSDGEESTDYDYTDYGTAIAAVPMANQIGYRAQMHDTSDTQNLRARNYDTNTGRFLQADSYRGALDDPRTQNRYIYGGNNPVLCLKRGTSKRIYLATNRQI